MAPRTIKISLFRNLAAGPEAIQIVAPYGAVLRECLLKNQFSPYREANRVLNCHGLGICGTCQVVIRDGALRERKRSCQIRCFRDLEIELE